MKVPTKKIILFGVLIGVFYLIRFSGIGEHLTLADLQRNKQELHGYVKTHYAFSVALYIGVYVISTAFSIPGAAVLTLAGGFLFGTFLCALYANAGATAGATMAFLSARYLIGGWFQDRYRRQLIRFNEEISRNGRFYLLTLRFVPIFPFFLINILAGLTNVPFKTFLWTTSLGIIPGSLAYAFAGTQLDTINSLGDVLSAKVIAAFLLLALLALMPVIIGKTRKNIKKTEA